MIELEKLYECAEKHLGNKIAKWDDFAKEFSSIYDAEFVLYRPTLEDNNLAWRSIDGLVAVSSPDLLDEYFDKGVFNFNAVPDNSLSPFEPVRRTDTIDDEEFDKLEITRLFYGENGLYYMMAVSALLSDKSPLILVVWRDEDKSDFTDIEKQRVALFMRYLSSLVKPIKDDLTQLPDQDVAIFGERHGLTHSEVDILSKLLLGLSLRSIAKNSNRSYGTIRWHVHHILEKCQVKSQRSLLTEFYRLIKR